MNTDEHGSEISGTGVGALPLGIGWWTENFLVIRPAVESVFIGVHPWFSCMARIT
jgi:hypothetical protein